jgi:L-aspartate oxidase
VTLADMEFVQFHPTALDTPENPARADLGGGARRGAILVNDKGVRFMLKEHRDASSRRATSCRARSTASRSGAASTSMHASSGRSFTKRFPGSSRCARRAASTRGRI